MDLAGSLQEAESQKSQQSLCRKKTHVDTAESLQEAESHGQSQQSLCRKQNHVDSVESLQEAELCGQSQQEAYNQAQQSLQEARDSGAKYDRQYWREAIISGLVYTMYNVAKNTAIFG